MKKEEKDSSISIRKRDFVWIGILIVIVVIGAIIFFQMKNPEKENSNVQDQESSNPEGNDTSTTNNQNNMNGGGGSNPGTGGSDSDTDLVQNNPSGTTTTTTNSGNNTTSNTAGTASSSITPTIFPYITYVKNNGKVNITDKSGKTYVLTVWWEGSYWDNIKSMLMLGKTKIKKIDHTFGEISGGYLDGTLKAGNVVFFDTNDNGVADLQFTHNINNYDSSLGLQIKVHNKNIEICSDGIDNDNNGLKDCQEEWCDNAEGDFHSGTQICTYGNETICYDGFNNDAEGFGDMYDRDCIGRPCTADLSTFVIWSYMPEDSQYQIPMSRLGCCPRKTDCINAAGECIEFDTFYVTSGGNAYYICGDNNNWDRCGKTITNEINKKVGDLSDGARWVCVKAGDIWGWAIK